MIKMSIEVSPEQAIEIAKILSTQTNSAPVQAAPTAPVMQVQQQAPVVPPVAAAASTTPIPTVVPTAQAAQVSPVTAPPVQQAPPVSMRKYTMDELALASRPICEAGRQAELLNLLHSFTYTDSAGNVQPVQSIQQLPEALYPNFANGIRALGGKI